MIQQVTPRRVTCTSSRKHCSPYVHSFLKETQNGFSQPLFDTFLFFLPFGKLLVTSNNTASTMNVCVSYGKHHLLCMSFTAFHAFIRQSVHTFKCLHARKYGLWLMVYTTRLFSMEAQDGHAFSTLSVRFEHSL